MPEGHTIHRLANEHARRFAGRPVALSSPQGRFSDGAALLDGQELVGAEAHGKHLFLEFPGEQWIHVHLGLAGVFRFGEFAEVEDPAGGVGPGPVVGVVRLRIVGEDAWSDLRGPNTCRVVTRAEKDTVHARLGPDPLRPDADPALAWARIQRSAKPIAELLMDQRVLAGVGNVYRAEALFRAGLDPHREGRLVKRATWDAMWADLVELMAEGVRLNRIDTVRPEHTPEAMGRPPRKDDHGGEVYVYRRTGMPCLVCGTEVRIEGLAGRNLFWCPTCQRKARARRKPRAA
ncbi:Fpg/Nei family DNA glycosylase [Yinghuangia seranimata]|uniref:Fpg/Nei family DNA glycosylase n=1 Tax=Yinghuangia seranimata TaxID=408067 RepID=UPI00248ADAEF|nr:DNA-formamidopyrimidine glycosylase family protein [Yinghuangia seranimata]MDI2127358.1 DNA-formamidopyrimidine glycosylase family protein [Yinghuangia seranimata]